MNVAFCTTFVLLQIIAITGNAMSFRPHHGKFIDLVRAANSVPMSNSVREDSMRVTTTRDGHVFFHTAAVSPIDLPNLIRDDLNKGAEHKIYLAVDARAKYEDVASVLDEIRQTKILNLAILAERTPSTR
jgi:biopolymer transport protein ExbD